MYLFNFDNLHSINKLEREFLDQLETIYNRNSANYVVIDEIHLNIFSEKDVASISPNDMCVTISGRYGRYFEGEDKKNFNFNGNFEFSVDFDSSIEDIGLKFKHYIEEHDC